MRLEDSFLTVRKLSGVKGAEGCFSYTAGHIWPYKFVLHLLKKAISQGVNLQTHTPVQQVSSSQDFEGYWTITTTRGAIRAKTVVYASNAYTSAILPEYKDSIVPVRGICCRITTPKSPAPYLPNSYILRSSGWEFDYLIPRTDGSIIVGGARGSYYQNLDSWYDNTDDSKLIQSAEYYFDGYMQRHFRGWEDSGAAVDKIWTGSESSKSFGMHDFSLISNQSWDTRLIVCLTLVRCHPSLANSLLLASLGMACLRYYSPLEALLL